MHYAVHAYDITVTFTSCILTPFLTVLGLKDTGGVLPQFGYVKQSFVSVDISVVLTLA